MPLLDFLFQREPINPLSEAIQSNDLDKVQAALAQGEDPNLVRKYAYHSNPYGSLSDTFSPMGMVLMRLHQLDVALSVANPILAALINAGAKATVKDADVLVKVLDHMAEIRKGKEEIECLGDLQNQNTLTLLTVMDEAGLPWRASLPTKQGRSILDCYAQAWEPTFVKSLKGGNEWWEAHNPASAQDRPEDPSDPMAQLMRRRSRRP
jgi:hypothetical protein